MTMTEKTEELIERYTEPADIKNLQETISGRVNEIISSSPDLRLCLGCKNLGSLKRCLVNSRGIVQATSHRPDLYWATSQMSLENCGCIIQQEDDRKNGGGKK